MKSRFWTRTGAAGGSNMGAIMAGMRRGIVQRGQSLVEIAIVMPILVMLLSGVLDLGRVFYIFIALEDAAGEAALYLSIEPYCEDSGDVDPDGNACVDPNNALYRAQHAVGESVIDWSRVTYTVMLPADPSNPSQVIRDVGEKVKVRLRYEVDLLTPVIPRFTGFNPLQLTVEADQTIVSE